MKGFFTSCPCLGRRPCCHCLRCYGNCGRGCDGHPIPDIDSLHRILTENRLGVPATLTLLRGTEKLDVKIVPIEAPVS